MIHSERWVTLYNERNMLTVFRKKKRDRGSVSCRGGLGRWDCGGRGEGRYLTARLS